MHLAEAHASCRTSPETSLKTSLQTSLVKGLAREKKFYQDLTSQSNPLKIKGLNNNSCDSATLQTLQKESLQKVKELENNEDFQTIVAELQTHSPPISSDFKDLTTHNKGDLLVFVSFSLGEKALLNLAQDAKQFGVTLVLRGFKDESYAKTVQALQTIIKKTGQGVIIDPELYSLFSITAVPTFILAKPFTLNPTERTQTPIHDTLQGHVSAHYALEVFAKEGDLKDEAQALLKRGAIK